jgi:hypothetical protein
MPDVEELVIQATWTDDESNLSATETVKIVRTKHTEVNTQGSTAQKFLHLSSSTQTANINEYVIFHVRNSFDLLGTLETIYYVIVAKSSIIHSSYLDIPSGSNVYSFSVAVSSEMTPSFKLVVFAVDQEGIVHSDSVTVPVNSIQLHKVSFGLNERKDYSMDTVEAVVFGESGAAFYSSANRELPSLTNAGNELTTAYVLNTLHSIDNFPVSPRVTKRWEKLNFNFVASRLIQIAP